MTTPKPHLSFPPFHLDLANEQLWRGAELVPLRPKAFRLLRYLAEHPQRLVTQEELLKAVWQHSYLSEGLLRGYIHELRGLLGDDAKAPHFIETASGRGYRFIASITPIPPVPSPIESSVPPTLQPPPGFVGRQEELAQLHRALERALLGERQVVFVAGEPGIGKTALVDAFLAQIVGAQGLRVGRGQCIDHYGAGEAYLPVFEALGRLARGAGGEQLVQLLRRQAPTWLVQMPAFIDEAELEMLSHRGYGATPERIAWELAGVLEALTAERPLVLWLEDLHWSDFSTVDALAMLAWRREPARLLVVGTYRPVGVMASGHPLQGLVRELEAHAQCRSLPLGFLTPPEVSQYLAARFAPLKSQAARLEEWGRFVHRHTDGNPLFMVTMVDDLMGQGVIGEAALERPWPAPPASLAGGLPESLRQLIDHQLNRLSQEERGVLEVASVAGIEFSAAWVAAALDTDVLEVEGCCEALTCRRLFLDSGKGRPTGPERRLAERYRFLHALHQHLLYERLPASRRRQLHQRVGESKETAFGSRRAEIAAELAVHFEEARDGPRAVHYLGQAAQNALRRSAGREASDNLTRALGRLQTLPEAPERAQQELSLQLSLGAALSMTQGYTAPEVKRAYDRAHALCGQIGESPHLFPALFGLFRFELTWGELQGARALAERLLRLAQAQPDPLLLPAAHVALGATLFHLGEPTAACTQVEQGLRVYDRHQQEALILQYGDDMGVMCLHYARVALQVLGYPDQALARSREAQALAEALSHPFTLAREITNNAFFYQFRRDGRTAQARAEAAIDLVAEHGFSPLWGAHGTLVRGWALAEQGQAEEGIAHLRHALDVYQTLGFCLRRPYNLGLLGEALGKAGRAQEGLAVLGEALATARRTGERSHEAELYWLQGELTLELLESGIPGVDVEAEVEACFEQALEIARSQGARLFELRAMMSLARLRMRQGKKQEVRIQLAEVYGRFTEGFDTKDLQEARALLETLA
jgi:DNA-binding winged helix-turn-helix (wHTH) protein/predicted ATPase